MAAWAATVTGWLWGRLSTPVPKRICLVRLMTVAKNIKGEVMRSLKELKCSPTNASLKPRRSASTMASWSSASSAP
jgi:hypothetical protein